MAVYDPCEEPLLTPAEVSALFRVDPRTVTRWAITGRLHSRRTPGGHRRFYEREVRAVMLGQKWEPPGGFPESPAVLTSVPRRHSAA
jgi:excisionase family DNA binding protein